MTPRAVVRVLVAAALAATVAFVADDVVSAADAPEPPTVTATSGPFSVVLEFSGAFDAPGAVEVVYRPEVYTGELEVVEAATPGVVTRGQRLVRFRTEKIDEQVQQAEIDLKIARTNLQRLTEETKRKEEASAIQLKKAEMDWKNAEQILKTYRDVEMPIKLEQAELNFQAAKDGMKDQEEEYAQLEKMYKGDDLVEETEEIVMRRAKRQLDRQRISMGFTERRHHLVKTVEIPRELANHEFNFQKATNDWELVKATAKLQVEQSASELEKAQTALTRQEQNLKKLQKDREALTVDAPEAGTLVPGQLLRGKWTGMDEVARALKPGGKLKANQVLFTIVQTGPKVVRTTVPEASVLELREGQAATVTPAATPKASLAAKVVRVARVATDGQFETWLEVEQPDSRLLPGNACKVKVKTTDKPDAVTVPSSAVAQEGEKSVVQLWQDGKAQPREVQVGATSQGRTEILSGLAAGERVLKSAPKAPAGKPE